MAESVFATRSRLSRFIRQNAGVDDGFGCETMEIAIFEAEDVACQMKRADLTAAVG